MARSLREIQNEVAKLEKEKREFAIRAEYTRLKKENDALSAAKDANNYELITRILSRSKRSTVLGVNIGTGETGNGTGILGYLINIFSSLFNRNSKDSLSVDQHNPHATTKHSLQKLTEKVQIDVDFTEVNQFIDEVAATHGNIKFGNLKFGKPTKAAFPNDDFNFISDGQDLVRLVVSNPDRKNQQNIAEINKLSLPGIISKVFENKNDFLGAGLTEAQKSQIAVQAATKAYTAKKYLRKKDVTKDKLLKVAENAKRQVTLYIKTSKYLDELYENTAQRNENDEIIANSEAQKTEFKLVKDSLSRSVLGTEFLNNMSTGNKLKFSGLNKNLSDKLLKISSYYDKATQACDNLDRDNVRKELMLCLNNLHEVESEADSLYREARRGKFIHREAKVDLKGIIENNQPLQNNGSLNQRTEQEIQADHMQIILKVSDKQKSMLEKLEKEYADLKGKQDHIDILNTKALHYALTVEEQRIVDEGAVLELEIKQKRIDRQNLIHSLTKELLAEKSKSCKTGFGE